MNTEGEKNRKKIILQFLTQQQLSSSSVNTEANNTYIYMVIKTPPTRKMCAVET